MLARMFSHTIAAAAVTLVGALALVRTVRAEPMWPSFRGVRASGVSESASLPTTWNVKTGENIKWKTAIPGLAHSSAIVWGERVYVTTAVSENPEPVLRVGLYGESPKNEESVPHDFKLYALDLKTGVVVWERTAHRGVPRIQRHIKSTHANSTPATDGKHIVAIFGSEGLFCFDRDGDKLWYRDLGLLQAGAFDVPELQWGFGSSPIIHDDRVIVQCDVNNQSFIAAFHVETGEPIWRKDRDEQAGWGTPTIHVQDGKTQIIVNGYKHIGAYDFETCDVVWKMRGGGDIPVPTPVIVDELIYITNAHGPQAPVYAIRTSARGDITLGKDEKSNEFVAWSYDRRGSYMQTPVVYRALLYACRDNGVLTCYDARTGEIKFRERLGDGATGFSASPVAGDGKVFYTTETGDVYVLKAGPSFEQLAVNAMDEVVMATPAIAEDLLLIRGRRHLFAIGN